VAKKIKTAFQRFQALASGLIKVPRKELDAKIKQLKKVKDQDRKRSS